MSWSLRAEWHLMAGTGRRSDRMMSLSQVAGKAFSEEALRLQGCKETIVEPQGGRAGCLRPEPRYQAPAERKPSLVTGVMKEHELRSLW